MALKRADMALKRADAGNKVGEQDVEAGGRGQ